MILGVLRGRTALFHERVERSVDLPNRLRSPVAYTSLLARFHGFYAPLEDRLAAAAGLHLATRRKAHLLRHDLLALGVAGADVDALPRCPDLPTVADAGDAFGCLYVLEGATLGGQVVRRQAEAALGLTPGRGCSFFTSYGERVGAMWKEFCRTLEGYAAANPWATDRIAAAALGTFAGLDRWLAGGVG
jgi:heme oxygenase